MSEFKQLIKEAEWCKFVMEDIGATQPSWIEGDEVEMTLEDEEGNSTVCTVSITEFARRSARVIDQLASLKAPRNEKRVAELEAEVERLKEEKDSAIRILARQIDKFHAALIERDALHVEIERLIEDRARFPDKPDDIGRMIHSHMENLKAGQSSAETYAKALRAELDSLKDSIRLAALQAIEVFEGNQDAKQAVEYMRELLLADARTAKPEVDHE